MSDPILCLDFDGVIHSYTNGWKGARTASDPPVPGTGAFLLKAVQHFRVAIFSSRTHRWGGRRAMKRYVRQILWDACLTKSDDMEAAWKATQGTPPEYIPWTAYDVRDVADHIHSAISYPLFKPSAAVTIDDRAITFSGEWPDPRELRSFRPWNKMPVKPVGLGATQTYPHPALDDTDEGALRMAIAYDPVDGIMRLEFGKPVAWIGLPPPEARMFAEMILRKLP